MYDEEELLPLSSVSQYGYCPRRAGLILLERDWSDNIHTAEGTQQHERAHRASKECRKSDALAFGVAVRSLELGLSGSVDCLELSADPSGCVLMGLYGHWKVRPVEYKHGVVRNEREYEMQLCAQAMCLEEMLGCRIGEGDLFYYNDHRRLAVPLGAALRDEVIAACVQLHRMVESGAIPEAVKSRKCRECSLMDLCLPQIADRCGKYREQLLRCASGSGDDA